MKLSLTSQYIITAAIAVFIAVMLHISSPEQCNIKGECISIDFNYKLDANANTNQICWSEDSCLKVDPTKDYNSVTLN